MPNIEFVVQPFGVRRSIAGKQPLHAFQDALGRRAPHQLQLIHVLGRHRGHQAINVGALRIEDLAQGFIGEATSFVHDDLSDQPVASRVATQNSVKPDSIARCSPRLLGRCCGDLPRPVIAPLDADQGVGDRLGNGGAKTGPVLSVFAFRRGGERPHTVEDRVFDLG